MGVSVTVTVSVSHEKVSKLQYLTSEGRESRSRLGLETEGTETLGLVSVSYKILELVSSRSCLR